MEKNISIACTVNNCSYHAQEENFCTLDKIQIGTHEQNPTQKECTDCNSFKMKSDCGCGCGCECN